MDTTGVNAVLDRVVHSGDAFTDSPDGWCTQVLLDSDLTIVTAPDKALHTLESALDGRACILENLRRFQHGRLPTSEVSRR